MGSPCLDGAGKCFLGALQTELEKRIAKDSEALVVEQEAEKFFLAWRQLGARRDEHRRGKWAPNLCKRNPNLSLMQPGSVWSSPEVHANATHTCHEFGQLHARNMIPS